jgi:glucose-1-phosphate thymidylyltransferase
MTARPASGPRPIGVIPAAGRARRLGRLPCSKEILPVAVRPQPSDRPVRVAIDDALDAFRTAAIRDVVIVLSSLKADIRSYLGDGREWDVDIEYVLIDDSPGSPFSIDRARPVLGDRPVALAYPDICFRPTDSVAQLLAAIERTSADLMLALVPSDAGHKVDLVRIDRAERVTALEIKPGAGRTGWTWTTAVWGPVFTEFLGRQVARFARGGENRRLAGTECHVGDVIQAAIEEGLTIEALTFASGGARDIGTADDLARVWRRPV